MEGLLNILEAHVGYDIVGFQQGALEISLLLSLKFSQSFLLFQ
jgi:hypothetical protein